MMVIVSLTSFLLLFHFISGSVGEGSYYRQYKVLTGYNPKSYYYTTDKNTYYTNPYLYHSYRYSSPVNDDNVYVTDMYGRTTVQSGSSLRSFRGFY
ncbi:hypothetical protein NQ314_007103 [Rhamnusium bicolor]|uniref:Uncharacterized protein n=1 Tax=Rhamnusium bicolor TaxID=1586634 RepID=A0AAV8YUT6_9CUCU|nr:hypothetical protein NQ314_007103 [Rhamnusium bicolor]